MPTTKRNVAETLGVSKQTVSNYIARLGLSDHVSRVGKVDVLDDHAVSVLASAISKGVPPSGYGGETASASEAVVVSLEARVSDLKEQVAYLSSELAEARASRDREVAELRGRLAEETERADRLAGRLADIAERQQAIAAVPWWRRGAVAARLLGPGSGPDATGRRG